MANAVANPAAAVRVRPRTAAARPSPIENYAISLILCLLVVLVFVALLEDTRHWFVLPTLIAGVLAGSDVVAWLRRQCDTFDPKALIGIVMFHTGFMAPLLHMGFQQHDPEFTSMIDDWGTRFGILGMFQVLALCCYKLSQRTFFGRTRIAKTVWVVNQVRFASIIVWAIAISGLFSAIVFVRLGGLAKEGEGVSADTATNLSWILMLADPLPILVMMGIVIYLARNPRPRSVTFILTLLAAFLVVQFFLLGLRGSRSAMGFSLFLVTVMAHYRLRRMPLKVVLMSVFVLFIGAYLYKFYKEAGSAGASAALSGAEERQRLGRATGVTPLAVLLGDMARANVQALALYRIQTHPDRYDLRWGKTYLMAAAVVIPRAVWKDKPNTRVEALTNLFYGEGTYGPTGRRSSRILGLMGESVLNFGLLGIPLMFLIYGAAVGWYRKKLLSLDPADGRLFIVPMVTLACLLVPFGDSDNISFGFLKNGALPIAVVLLSTMRIRRPALAAGAANVVPR